MKHENKMPCVACGTVLGNVGPWDPSHNQPSGGLEFVTYGHYGSTTFDPNDASYVILNVCDPCVTKAREARHAICMPPLRRTR